MLESQLAKNNMKLFLIEYNLVELLLVVADSRVYT